MAVSDFRKRGPSPGAAITWWSRTYAPNAVSYQLPSGKTGMVIPHRLYRSPEGRPMTGSHVIRGKTTKIRRWLPATTSLLSPTASSNAWVQLSLQSPDVGIMHAPGVVSRPVKVLQVRTKDDGTTEAFVENRLPQVIAVNPSRVVSTRTLPSRTSTRPARTANEWISLVFPWARIR
jgi:hypothetical protein